MAGEESLLKKLNAEPSEKTFEIGKGEKKVKVKLRTLTQEELDEAVSSSVRGDVISRGEAEKIPILSYSLLAIDDIPVQSSSEIKAVMKQNDKFTLSQAKRQVIKGWGQTVVGALYLKYLELVDLERKELGEVGDFF